MSAKPRLHLIGLFHTIHNQAYSHCAFTGKALRFPKMLQAHGYKVTEYSNEGSESTADTKLVMLRKDELHSMTGDRDKTAFHGDLASLGTPWHTEFEKRLLHALKENVQPRDIICHPFGHAHSAAMHAFPNHAHVETGIGYPTLMPGSFKIFESYAWRHYHAGRDGRQGENYEWVIPNYFDIDDWEPCYEQGKYLAFLGRIDTCKGLDTLFEIAKYSNKRVVICGQGDHKKWAHPNIEYWGPIHGKQRSFFLRNAACSLMPTQFIEPFGGSGVEGLLCGTPLVAADYGAFTETVQSGVNGYRCKTLVDWLDAIEAVEHLNRRRIAEEARAKYSLQVCGALYDKAFTMIDELHEAGWYTLPEKYKQLHPT